MNIVDVGAKHRDLDQGLARRQACRELGDGGAIGVGLDFHLAVGGLQGLSGNAEAGLAQAQCGQPVWICHNSEVDIDFKLVNDMCFGMREKDQTDAGLVRIRQSTGDVWGEVRKCP